MNMKTHLATLVVVLVTSGPLMSATEVERLQALCAEQEMQIRQLEEKISQLTNTPPPSHPAGSPIRDSQPVSDETTYTVKSGDSIERIARHHGIKLSTLAKLNDLKADSLIHPGQKIKIPGKTAMVENQAVTTPAKASHTHTVAAGETFYKISTKYGVSVDELIAANPGVNHKALRVGQKIKVEIAATTVATAPPSLTTVHTTSILNNPKPIQKPRASERPVRIEKEITYGQFAAQHDTTTRRLDELNGLELDPSTVLAQGSELYTPAQP